MNTISLTRAAVFLCVFLRMANAASPVDPSMDALLKEASAGNSTAQFLVGRAYHRGEGLAKDNAKSLEWLTKAAEAGNPEAMDGLGYIYLSGAGVAASEQTALEWYSKGAKAGLPKAQYNYGLLLRQGKEIQTSNQESLKWLTAAAQAGFVEANAALGRTFYSGDRLQPRDPVRSYEFIKVAAEAGDPVCQNIMGLICRRGVGAPARHKDPESAEGWFRKAAMQGDRKAQTNLAVQIGLTQSSSRQTEALEWLMVAKNQNEPNAVRTFNEISHLFSAEQIDAANRSATERLRNLSKKVPPRTDGAKP